VKTLPALDTLQDQEIRAARGELDVGGADDRPSSGAAGPCPGPARPGSSGCDRDDRADRGQVARRRTRSGPAGARRSAEPSARPRGLPGVPDEGEGPSRMSNNAAIAAVTRAGTTAAPAASTNGPDSRQTVPPTCSSASAASPNSATGAPWFPSFSARRRCVPGYLLCERAFSHRSRSRCPRCRSGTGWLRAPQRPRP